MKRYPVQVSYIAKSAIWGGQTLREKWGKQGTGENIAETWELSVRKDEMAVIGNGEAKGMTLADYIDACGADCVSPAYRKGERFPMLVKLIDAEDKLSVQVHPDDAYASAVEGDSGKTEMWYIVDAREGATIIYGLKEGVSRETFAEAVRTGRLDEVMNTVPVRAGESYFIPAGMLHAIGAGILIAEIQQNSDLTYRVYDYDRRGADGSLRPLHTAKALDVVRPYTEAEVESIRFAQGHPSEGDCLANSKYFKVHRVSVMGTQAFCRGQESFASLLCLEGKGALRWDGESYPIGQGDSYFLPAGMGDYEISGELTLIASEI